MFGLSHLTIILLIFVITFFLLLGIFSICKAMFHKARFVQRKRHIKVWMPSILQGLRPSRSSELILPPSENTSEQLSLKTSEGSAFVRMDSSNNGLLTVCAELNDTTTSSIATLDLSSNEEIISDSGFFSQSQCVTSGSCDEDMI